MRLLILLLVSVCILNGLSSCKKEKCHDPSNKDCDNYDPCYGVKPVIAEIKLSQRAAPSVQGELGKLYLDEQDIFPQAQIKFDTPLEGANYTWIIGSEILTSKSFERHFFSTPFGTYSVKLIVEKDPNKNCYPMDDGKDTLIKTFEIVPICQLQSIGIYKGKWEGISGDSALISFRTFYDGTFTDSCSFGLNRYTNLQNKQDTLYGGHTIIANTEIVNYDPGSLSIGNLNLKINPVDKSVVIDYYIGTKHYLFKGRKIAN